MHPPRTASRLLQRPGGLSAFVCRRCLTRSLASAAATVPASGFAALESRRLISVSGPDAAKYLQGVITADILGPDKTPRTSGFYTAFLSAQGRVLFDVFIYPGLGPPGVAAGHGAAGSFLVEVDANEAESLVRHIKRYKLRAKFDLRLLDPEEATVWQAWDDSRQADPFPAASLDAAAAKPANPRVLLRDPRSPTLGSRVITAGAGDAAAASTLSSFLGLEPTLELMYRVRRYLDGVAEGQTELPRGQALPAESNLDLCGAIDFRKGCYVGQELTIRTRHRGVVRKRVLPCMIYDGPTPPESLRYEPSSHPLLEDDVPECDLIDDDSEFPVDLPPPPADVIPYGESIRRVAIGGRDAAKWLAGTGNIGLALCRLDVMTDLPPLPGEAPKYDPESRFIVSAFPPGRFAMLPSQTFGVKAFVPDWLRRGLAEQAGAAARGH